MLVKAALSMVSNIMRMAGKSPSAAAHSGARATASSENVMLFRRFKGIYSPRKKVEAAKSS